MKSIIKIHSKYKEGEKIKTKEFRKVGTHNGRFHADEVMATAILKEVFDIEVVRTRDPEVLGSLDLVYDVGDGEFDHHQVEKVRRDNGTPFAACGLIWRKFGKLAVMYKCISMSEEEIEEIYKNIDKMLIEGIDAHDNGIRTCITIIPTTSISTIITEFNPTWDVDQQDSDIHFEKAVKFASTVLDNALNQQISAIKARIKVAEAYNNRIRPEVVVLDTNYPWPRALSRIDVQKEVLFVVFPRDGEYLIQTVRGGGGPFRDRKRLPKAWAGKRDTELCQIIGIEDAIFCHSARFIAGARSFESIMKMADLAIAEPEDIKPRRGFLYKLKKLLFRKFESNR
jgi:uncharacterized UPF0160 family protein